MSANSISQHAVSRPGARRAAAVLAAASLMSGAVAWADCPVINFEDYAVNTAITTQYPGVTFSVQGMPSSCGASYGRIQIPAQGCSSPTRALIVDGGATPSADCEFHPQWLRMVFDNPVDFVRFSVGPGNTEDFQDYDIRAYSTTSGASGLVDTVAVTDAGDGVFRAVELTSATVNIRRVEIKGMTGANLAGVEAIDDLQVGRDLTPPVAQIASPDGMTCVCSGVSIVGSANDPESDVNWRLERKSVDPAVTAWTLIRVSTVEIDGAELSQWFPAGSADAGFYFLRLTVENTCGLESVATAVVYLDKQAPTTTLRFPATGTVVGGDIAVDGTVWDQCGGDFRVEYSPAGSAVWTPVTSKLPAWIINDTYATWNTRTGVPDGDFDLRTTTWDGCDNQGTATNTLTIDNTRPSTVITDPVECDYVQGVLRISGTVADAHMGGWVLEYTGGDSHGWTTINSGSRSMINTVIGSWDTRELRWCAYTLRLRASDAAVVDSNSAIHNTSEYLVSVNVGLLGDMNCDGAVDNGDIDAFVNCLLTGDCTCP